MSKELEAFNIIVEMFNQYANKPNDIGEFFKFTLSCKLVEKSLKALEILKAFGFEIEDYTEDENGSISVKFKRIILDDEEIDLLKEVVL